MELFSIRIQRTFQLVSTLSEFRECGNGGKRNDKGRAEQTGCEIESRLSLWRKAKTPAMIP